MAAVFWVLLLADQRILAIDLSSRALPEANTAFEASRCTVIRKVLPK